jgi:hypothetical protein
VGSIHPARPVKSICGVLFHGKADLRNLTASLEKIMGPEEFRSPVFPFTFTAYYREEMGPGLEKVFLSFCGLTAPDRLPEIKHHTNELEREYTVNSRRKVNLDPGYMTGAKLVLASTKNFAHRIYLGDGIYGDVQLRYIRGEFRASEWTYPDYRTDLALEFFRRVREKIVKETRIHEKTDIL